MGLHKAEKLIIPLSAAASYSVDFQRLSSQEPLFSSFKPSFSSAKMPIQNIAPLPTQ
jgi:hypothetical protein